MKKIFNSIILLLLAISICGLLISGGLIIPVAYAGGDGISAEINSTSNYSVKPTEETVNSVANESTQGAVPQQPVQVKSNSSKRRIVLGLVGVVAVGWYFLRARRASVSQTPKHRSGNKKIGA